MTKTAAYQPTTSKKKSATARRTDAVGPPGGVDPSVRGAGAAGPVGPPRFRRFASLERERPVMGASVLPSRSHPNPLPTDGVDCPQPPRAATRK